jgi:sterol desaturase/sphingolipid hydroxylase (fatty acid hydroxylase superfamily)
MFDQLNELLVTLSQNDTLKSVGQNLMWFAVCGALFTTLALARPQKADQKVIRPGMHADLVYWFIGPLIYGALYVGLTAAAVDALFSSPSEANRYFMAGLFGVGLLPILVQAVIILVIMDFIQYWTHRWFHTGALWKFHAIHHGPENVDWLTSVRFHPVNTLVHSTTVSAAVWLMGFHPAAWAILVPFNYLYSTMVHANLNWDFGPFKKVFASPVFHRWHHSSEPEAQDKNFAPTFPILDVIFGTYYMPEGKRPTSFGVMGDTVPETLIGQMLYPFKGTKTEIPNSENSSRVTTVSSPGA